MWYLFQGEFGLDINVLRVKLSTTLSVWRVQILLALSRATHHSQALLPAHARSEQVVQLKYRCGDPRYTGLALQHWGESGLVLNAFESHLCATLPALNVLRGEPRCSEPELDMTLLAS